MWRENRKNAGFSLLELLAVMSIMALLTTLSVTSYFSAVRGMGRRSAVTNLANTFIQARQRACMDNARVSVVMYNKITGPEDADVRPSYVVCNSVGKVTYYANNNIVDEFTALDTIFSKVNLGSNYKGAIKLYNLTQGGFSYVFPWVEQYPLQNRYSAYKPNKAYTINAYAFKINGNIPSRQGGDVWDVGDSYGVESAPVQTMPRGFQISSLGDSPTEVEFVTFLPDGRALSQKTITIVEIRDQTRSVTMKVATDGSITYDENW